MKFKKKYENKNKQNEKLELNTYLEHIKIRRNIF